MKKTWMAIFKLNILYKIKELVLPARNNTQKNDIELSHMWSMPLVDIQKVFVITDEPVCSSVWLYANQFKHLSLKRKFSLTSKGTPYYIDLFILCIFFCTLLHLWLNNIFHWFNFIFPLIELGSLRVGSQPVFFTAGAPVCTALSCVLLIVDIWVKNDF